MKTFESFAELVDHLTVLGRTPSAESDGFTELEHGLQTAALLEQQYPDDDELIAAGLLHDLAHIWDGPGQPRHGGLGAAAVRPLLGDRVADLIEGHVAAKRYLVATRPEYHARLSADSVMTLEAQGGAMTDSEVAAFETDPYLDAIVALRIADDGAKVVGAVTPPLEHWLPAIRRSLRVAS
jgi:predicted HD phosphohydrolase